MQPLEIRWEHGAIFGTCSQICSFGKVEFGRVQLIRKAAEERNPAFIIKAGESDSLNLRLMLHVASFLEVLSETLHETPGYLFCFVSGMRQDEFDRLPIRNPFDPQAPCENALRRCPVL